MAAGDVRRVPAAPPRDHLRDQPPVPRRGAGPVPRGRRTAAADVADRRGRRQDRAHGAPRNRRQPRDQRCRGAALRSAQGQRAQGLLRAVAGTVLQQDQRCHAAALPRAVQPRAAWAPRPHDRRRLADRPRPASRARGLRRAIPSSSGEWRDVKRANKARLAEYVHSTTGVELDPGLAVRHSGQAHPRVQAPAPVRAAHHHAVPPAEAEPGSRDPAAGLRLRRQGGARATSWPSESSS